MRRSSRRGIFLDLDGVLTAGEGVQRLAFDRFAITCGAAPQSQVFVEIAGLAAPVAAAQLKRRWSLSLDIGVLRQRFSECLDGALAEIAPAPGAAAVLEAASRHGWTVGLVSVASAASARRWLARTRLASLVDIVVGGDELCLSKPEPESYRMALRRSGCAADLSTALEGSRNGVKSALAAGIRTYGLASADSAAEDWPQSARLIDRIEAILPELERQRRRHAATA
jgi:beta-phosphoglucomutase-like phosphatase (HAD superfamily)